MITKSSTLTTFMTIAMIASFKPASIVAMTATTSSTSSSSISPSPTSSSSSPLTEQYFPGSKSITPDDLRALSRQLGTHRSVAQASIGVPSNCKCQYNYPQAFLLDPIPPPRTEHALQRMSSSLLKLTCPLLVEAIDELEDEGGIEQLNQKLLSEGESGDDNNEKGREIVEGKNKSSSNNSRWVEAAIHANKVHASSRNEILMHKFNNNKEDMDLALHSKLGERGAVYFKTAGVAGMTSTTTTVKDLKCLHAHVADTLFRGDADAPIGSKVLQNLNVPVEGANDCWKRCCPPSDIISSAVGDDNVQEDDVVIPAAPAPRNKQRKKRVKEIARKKRRREEAEKKKE
uniref:Uncharacterized protein n=1 Tax=Ditylum brightwellii TaxID=49249 RepID=A0A7S4RU17_9STRA|mmetsp:Transcript_29578/g.44683  ORF Transcript_29578/g.44683 Transcript_29578/m.44683 type:complete len:345 (+) Transcript_29578:67-1101(+)